ncbi:MAG: FAD-binding oxidoreductase [Flavobacteriaceae bacterium]|nr:FAD-binding oxidoreductase [Flavobacteriaceae bacterium]
MAKFYMLTIKELIQETHNSVSILFTIPKSLNSVFSFVPGQYVTVQKQLNGEQVRRDYSICASQNSGEIKIGVKAVEDGTFSQFATSQLKVGDALEVSAPQGRFQLKTHSENRKNYLAFAAGSGITPIMSMIYSALEIEPQSTFVLVYGNQTLEDVMFKKELDSLSERYTERFFIYYIFSRSSYDNHLKGRIDGSIANLILDEKHDGVQFDDYFLCGPEPMINTVKDTLKSKGISESNIHFELFTVSTAVNAEVDRIENLSGETVITVHLDDEEETFTMPKESTILERVLLQGLDAPYSCQGGICSTCIAQVVEGRAVMEKNSILSDEEVEEGLILTCQAHPVTDTIEVDYDNV